MRTHWLGVALLTCGLIGLSPWATAGSKQKLTREVQDTIRIFKKADPGLEKFFEESAGYAIFPRVAKGAFGVGAARGTGQVFEQGRLIGEATLTQLTIGLQLGGQVYAEVIFFEDSSALKAFKESRLEFSAQASAVAAAEGAAANAKYRLGVAVFTIARGGLMYEASIGGQKFKFKPYND